MREMIQTAVGKCTNCATYSGGGGVCKMESPDVTITFCEDGAEWSNYLSRCLNQQDDDADAVSSPSGTPLQPHVHLQLLEQLPLPPSKAKIGFFLRAKANLLVVSPNFLQFVLDHPSVMLGELFVPKRVLALMCGVHDSDVTALHRASLLGYEDWHRVAVEENDNGACVAHLMEVANQLLLHSADSHRTVGGRGHRDETRVRPRFRLNPCKAREGSAKITIEFVNPVPEGHVIGVTIEKEFDSVSLIAKRYNPYNAKFIVPDRFFGESQIVEISVTCDLDCYGAMPLKCESKMAQLNNLLQTVNSPLSFVCETLGLSSSRLEDLDRYLVDNFKKTVPKCGFSLIADFDKDIVRQKADEELPTLLHWAAKMGLRELCSVLLDCVGAAEACRLLNCRGLNASDIAEMDGHSCLANMLENYARLSESAEIYTYMKSMSEDGNAESYQNLRSMVCRNEQEIAPSCPPLESTDNRDVTQSDSSPKVNFNLEGYTGGQRELLELLDDFKNEKYSLAEVELLFHNWQMRQKTNSFAEKEKQLNLMRQQYEQMQNKCQQDNKKTPTLRKLWSFLGPKVKKDANVNRILKVETVYVRNSNNDCEISSPTLRERVRPPSTWSAGSSSLSDRSSTMSVLSVCSTSDSGALTDIEEEHKNTSYSRKRKESNPKPLIKPAVPNMVDNKQYMFVKDQNQRPLPKTPINRSKSNTPPVKSVSSPVREARMPPTAKITKTPSWASISDRKPMPPPRWEAGSPVSNSGSCSPDRNISPCNISVPIHRPDFGVSVCRSAPDSDSVPPVSVSPKPGTTANYMPMSSASPAGSTSSLHVNSTSAPAVIIDEPDYCNWPGPGDYMDMRSQVNADKQTSGATYVPKANVDNSVAKSPNPLFSYMGGVSGMESLAMKLNLELRRRQCQRSPDDQGDRCDSVPDCAPPSPPRQHPPSMPSQAPPPVPPRNNS